MTVNQRHLVVMSESEVSRFLEHSRVATLATIGPGGFPHLVAMWYGLVDGAICFASKAKAQKVRNLRRNPKVAVMVEAGDSYAELRGVAIEGWADIIENSEAHPDYRRTGISLYERYTGPYTEGASVQLKANLRNRVVVRIKPERVRSWDHRKLNSDRLSVSGTTSRYLQSGL